MGKFYLTEASKKKAERKKRRQIESASKKRRIAKQRAKGYRLVKLTKIEEAHKKNKNKDYNHPKWLALRKLILQRDCFKCQKCGSTDKILHVHHKKYGTGKIWEVRKSWLITWCEVCHSLHHGRDLTKAQDLDLKKKSPKLPSPTINL